MKRFTAIILLILTILLASCANNDTAKIEDAVNSQMSPILNQGYRTFTRPFFRQHSGLNTLLPTHSPPDAILTRNC